MDHLKDHEDDLHLTKISLSRTFTYTRTQPKTALQNS